MPTLTDALHVFHQPADQTPLAAAASKPTTVTGPTLDELDEAADAMAALVAKYVGRVAGHAARQLGRVVTAATEPLWVFEAPNQARDEHGRWTDGGGDGLDTSAEPELVATGSAGGYPVAAFTDHDGVYGQPGGRLVSVATSGHADWSQGPDEGEVFTAGEARHLAGGVDSVAKTAATMPTPSAPHAFDRGPALLNSSEVGGYRVSAFHDRDGDLVGEGQRFVQVRDASANWRDPLGSDGRILDVNLTDVPDFVGGIQAMAGGTVASALWKFTVTAQTPPPPTPRQAAVSADDIGVITDQWTVVVNTVLAPAIANQYVRAARAQAARVAEIVQTANLTEEQLAQFSLPLIDLQEAAQQAAADAANRLANIGDDLWGNARSSLTEGMAAGESVPRLAERVRAATGVTLPRATVIARTESMAARNAGAYDEMTTVARLGIVDSKTWLATHDARTRPTHVAADGQTVPFDGKFTVGGWPADRPHDPALPAEEAANCRCTLLFNLSGEEPVYPLTSSLHTFHLPGHHDQHSHGHGVSQIEDLPRMRGKPTVTGAAQGTNPHYGSTAENPIYYREAKAGKNWTPEMGPPPRDAYEENCTNTVMAFEMRMRGYDVHAGPLHILDQGGYAGGRTTREFDEQLKSSWTLPGGRPHGRSLSGQPWTSHKDIDKQVRSWPEGARGVVWSGKHVYSVVNVRGKTQYVEPQFDASPSRVVTGEYRRKYAQGKLIRLDDLAPAGGILEAVVPA